MKKSPVCLECSTTKDLYVEAHDRSRVFCGTQCQGVFYAIGGNYNEDVSQLCSLSFSELSKVRHAQLKEMIDTGSGFFEQWLRTFSAPLNKTQKKEASAFLESLPWPAEKMLLAQVILGLKQVENSEHIQRALQYAVFDPSSFNNYAFTLASFTGSLDSASLLLSDHRVDPSVQGNIALLQAASKGFTTIVHLILKHPRFDGHDLNDAILNAAMHNHPEIVRLLVMDKRVQNVDQVFRTAVTEGFNQCVQVLLESGRVSSELIDERPLLENAVLHGRLGIVKLLLPRCYSERFAEKLLSLCASRFGRPVSGYIQRYIEQRKAPIKRLKTEKENN